MLNKVCGAGAGMSMVGFLSFTIAALSPEPIPSTGNPSRLWIGAAVSMAAFIVLAIGWLLTRSSDEHPNISQAPKNVASVAQSGGATGIVASSNQHGGINAHTVYNVHLPVPPAHEPPKDADLSLRGYCDGNVGRIEITNKGSPQNFRIQVQAVAFKPQRFAVGGTDPIPPFDCTWSNGRQQTRASKGEKAVATVVSWGKMRTKEPLPGLGTMSREVAVVLARSTTVGIPSKITLQFVVLCSDSNPVPGEAVLDLQTRYEVAPITEAVRKSMGLPGLSLYNPLVAKFTAFKGQL